MRREEGDEEGVIGGGGGESGGSKTVFPISCLRIEQEKDEH